MTNAGRCLLIAAAIISYTTGMTLSCLNIEGCMDSYFAGALTFGSIWILFTVSIPQRPK